jgi:SAM-dependent methyltransferase
MSKTDRLAGQSAQLPPLPVYLDARASYAQHYLFGCGIEIGPLHQPLTVPAHATVSYVDRMSAPDLRREYPELADWDLAEVDIVDDGELLATVPDESQDFIVANHFLEHTEDPIGTIETHLGKLRPGGILFYAVPDKRFTFDFKRPVTPLEHMIADHEEGPERSRAEHYDEWCRLVINDQSTGDPDLPASEEWVEQRARELEDAEYSIHMHVWTQAEFLRLILAIGERSGGALDIEAAARVGIEFLVVLRKSGPLPAPEVRTAQETVAARQTPSGAIATLKIGARRALGSGRAQLRRRRARP